MLRLIFIDIKARARDLSGVQGGGKGRFIHHIAAGDVDQDAMRGHLRQGLGIDQMVGGGATGDGDHHEIGVQGFGH